MLGAIRASQLGMKVAICRKRISWRHLFKQFALFPTKALLKSAQVFSYVNKSDDFGINVKNASINFDSVINRSRSVADQMTLGVNNYKNKVDVIKGFGIINQEIRLKLLITAMSPVRSRM